ncbi:MAG: cell division protein FtsL [candidate division Zixibacteria bacterium]|nr:cell division protein FtsL [candidate division Zixibacteria bacterium]
MGGRRSPVMGGLHFLGWDIMVSLAFQGRFAGLVSFGKTIGILLLVIFLAASFVLERYHIARVAIDSGRLEGEVKQLHKNKAYLQSQVSQLESLDHVGSVAAEKFGLGIPHPDQIAWLTDSVLGSSQGRSVLTRAINRIGYLYAGLKVPSVVRSSAAANVRTSE